MIVTSLCHTLVYEYIPLTKINSEYSLRYLQKSSLLMKGRYNPKIVNFDCSILLKELEIRSNFFNKSNCGIFKHANISIRVIEWLIPLQSYMNGIDQCVYVCGLFSRVLPTVKRFRCLIEFWVDCSSR